MSHDASASESLRILVIVSRPLDLRDLPDLADQLALQRGLQRVKAPVYLKMLRPPTVEAFRTEINSVDGYDVVHFDGHGHFGLRCKNCGALNLPGKKMCERCEALLEGQKLGGFLPFEREDGLQDALAAEELAEIITNAPDRAARLVFLSACDSANGEKAGLQSVLLESGVPAVLAMNESIPAEATIALVEPFYAALGASQSISQALENALPALRRLENGSKLQKIPALDGPGKDARLVTVKAVGRARFEPERIYGLPEHEFVGDFLRGADLSDPPRGRKVLLSQTMNAFLGDEKLVVLTGQGGIGKTALAEKAARRLAWRYLGGVFFRSAADVERLGLDELLNAFDNVFGQEFRTLNLDSKRDRVLSRLRNFESSSLIVVDNAESITDREVWRFLEGIPKPSAVLVTARKSLPCGGREIRVPEMESEEAGRLLLTEARKRAPKWGEHPSHEDQASLKEIASAMKGHPLAIKLVAALMSRQSLTSIRDELRKNPPNGVTERFDVSYNGLTAKQRDLFSRLAVFSGSMTEEAVGEICIDEDSSGWQSDLGELEQRSFLDRIEIAAGNEAGEEVTHYRYRLHPLMRQYAAGKAGDELLARLRSKAAGYFLDYARQFKSNFDMLELERENILAGMDWAVGQQKSSSGEARRAASTLVLGFMAVLDRYLDTRGYWNEYLRRLQQAIDAAEMIDNRKQKAGCIHNLGTLVQRMGMNEEARKLYQQSLKIFQELGDKSGVSRSLHQLGMLAQDTGEYEEARKLYQQSLKIDQELGDKRGVSKSLHQLGMLAQNTGEYEEARKLYQKSLKIKEELGDKSDVSRSLHQLGMLAQDTGEYEVARKLYQQNLKIFQELGDKSCVSRSLHQLGMLAQDTEEYEEARKLYQQSLKIKEELGDKRGVSISLHQLGMLAHGTGEYEEARKLYQKSLKIKEELGDKRGVSRSLHQLGILAQDTGEYDEARKIYQQSLKIFQDLGDKSGVALSRAQLALLEEKMGNIKEALQLIRQAEAAFLELRSPYAKLAGEVRQRLEQKQ